MPFPPVLVRESLHARLGNLVGLLDGTCDVGKLVGYLDGLIVGADGYDVGIDEGVPVVGCIDLNFVGLTVGSMELGMKVVGIKEGSKEGLHDVAVVVGVLVGFRLGLEVGILVGLQLGNALEG